jgi:hypothetical protein
VVAGAVVAQQPNASACASARLGNRSSHAMAYDANARRVLLFGGASDDPADPLPRTLWSWDGTRWHCLADGGPAGRADAFLAFDAARNRLVLFGGRQFLPERRVRYLFDTWEWDGARWTLVDTAGPGPRIHGAAAYDPVRRAVVIHGGADTTDLRHDTWEWTGGRWREVALHVVRDGVGNALFRNGERGVALLVGVRDSIACAGIRRAVMFEVGRDSLTLMPTTGPSPCFSPHTPATVAPAGFLLFAGWSPNEPASSWTWVASRWQRSDTAPSRRRGAAAAYDEHRRRVVLFGGNDERGPLGDTWEWDGHEWRNRGEAAPSGAR